MLILFHMYYFFVGRGASVVVVFKISNNFSNIIFFLILDQQNKVQEFLVLGSQVNALYDFDWKTLHHIYIYLSKP